MASSLILDGNHSLGGGSSSGDGGGGTSEVTQAELDALQAQVDAIPQPENYRAATALNAYKLVTTDSAGGLIYADAATPSHFNRIVGLTVGAAASGADCTVESSGQVSNSGWSWPVGALLYVGLDGAISTDATIGNFCQQIGYASSSTTVVLTISRGIRRAI